LAAAARRTPARRWLAAVAVAAVAVAALALAAPAGASIIGPRAGHSPNANDIRTAYWIALAVAAVVAVAANVALIAAVLRFRERRGLVPPRIAAGRGFFVRAGTPLAALAVALLVVGIVITVDAENAASPGTSQVKASAAQTAQVSVRGVDSQALSQAIQTLRNTTPTGGPIGGAVKGGPLQIDAIAQQWIWRFFYPGGPNSAGTAWTPTGGRPGDRTYGYTTLVVPVDTTVVLNITSTDVLHSWFVPALGGQVQAVPGHVTQTWFRADRTGQYRGQSTTFSGTGYATMRIYVDVVTGGQYRAYLDRKARDLAAAQNYVNGVVTHGDVPGEGQP
jgi:heme/copper-type cytochrome/quinol oxidase subunit 2